MDDHDSILGTLSGSKDSSIVVAGPGSGKTTLIVQRINQLVNLGERPEDIVAITYTNAASKVLLKRIGFKIGFCGTMHGYLLTLLNRRQKERGRGSYSICPDTQIDTQIDMQIAAFGAKRTIKSSEIKKDKLDVFMSDSIDAPYPRTKQAIVTREYRDAMLREKTLDFDMIVSEGTRLILDMCENVFSPKLGAHLFVDEFQDISEWDWVLYKSMFTLFSDVMIVGDPNQAIFGFRGGSSHAIMSLMSDADFDNWKHFTLQGNFRSTSSICDAANKLMGRITTVSKRDDDIPCVEFTECESTSDKERRIVDLLSDRREEEFAILCRTNRQCIEWRDALTDAGLPTASMFFNPPKDWKLMRSIVSLAQNPQNNIMATAFLWSMDVPMSEIEEKTRTARKLGKNLNDVVPMLEKFSANIDVLDLCVEYGVSRESRWYLEEAVKQQRDNGTNPNLILSEFEQDFVTKTSGIVVTTAHSAKGGEWANVIIPCCEEGEFPLSRKSTDMDEERRLFYVAVTRAKHTVRLFASRTIVPAWKPQGTVVTAGISRFVHDMIVG